jgi:surface antigen
LVHTLNAELQFQNAPRERGARRVNRAVVSVFALAVILLGAVVLYVNANVHSSEYTSDNLIVTSAFTPIQPESVQLNLESLSSLSGVGVWKTPIAANFTDKAERDAAAAAVAAAAEANRIAMNERALQSIKAQVQGVTPGGIPSSPAPLAPGNGYAAGTCTWYAYNRRAQLGRPVPNMLGNGGSWHLNAPAHGLGANNVPEVGAVFEQSGHVGVVEAVGENDTIIISEMNWGGLYRYGTRTISNASSYWYIH